MLSPRRCRLPEKSGERAASGICVRSQNAWSSAGSRRACSSEFSAASALAPAICPSGAPRARSETTCCHFLVAGNLPSRTCPMGLPPKSAGILVSLSGLKIKCTLGNRFGGAPFPTGPHSRVSGTAAPSSDCFVVARWSAPAGDGSDCANLRDLKAQEDYIERTILSRGKRWPTSFKILRPSITRLSSLLLGLLCVTCSFFVVRTLAKDLQPGVLGHDDRRSH